MAVQRMMLVERRQREAAQAEAAELRAQLAELAPAEEEGLEEAEAVAA